ncbi:MAG: hemoglobin [Phycisphaerales bacterium]|jgi:hemoglobin
MTNSSTPSGGDLPLQLTDPASDLASVGHESQIVTESEIRTLVDTFYEEVREDSLLGPVFAEQVGDWSAHLPKMYDFWSTVVLRTGRYSGRPLEAHEVIPGLTSAHFARWLELWGRVVAQTIPAAAQPGFLAPAQRMAGTIESRVLGRA